VKKPSQSPWLAALVSWAPFLFLNRLSGLLHGQMQTEANKAFVVRQEPAPPADRQHQKKVTFKDVAGVSKKPRKSCRKSSTF
jgi:ATP-dependent Zn protease